MEALTSISNDRESRLAISFLLGLGFNRERPIDDPDPRKVRYLIKENVHHRIRVDLSLMLATFTNKARLSSTKVVLTPSFSEFTAVLQRLDREQKEDTISLRRTRQNADWDLDHAASMVSRGKYPMN